MKVSAHEKIDTVVRIYHLPPRNSSRNRGKYPAFPVHDKKNNDDSNVPETLLW